MRVIERKRETNGRREREREGLERGRARERETNRQRDRASRGAVVLRGRRNSIA
jgi:hypothetical protein